MSYERQNIKNDWLIFDNPNIFRIYDWLAVSNLIDFGLT